MFWIGGWLVGRFRGRSARLDVGILNTEQVGGWGEGGGWLCSVDGGPDVWLHVLYMHVQWTILMFIVQVTHQGDDHWSNIYPRLPKILYFATLQNQLQLVLILWILFGLITMIWFGLSGLTCRSMSSSLRLLLKAVVIFCLSTHPSQAWNMVPSYILHCWLSLIWSLSSTFPTTCSVTYDLHCYQCCQWLLSILKR